MFNCSKILSFLLSHWCIGFPKIPPDHSLVNCKQIVIRVMNSVDRDHENLRLQLGKYRL